MTANEEQDRGAADETRLGAGAGDYHVVTGPGCRDVDIGDGTGQHNVFAPTPEDGSPDPDPDQDVWDYLDGERKEDPPVPVWDPGPEIDDEGGMSEHRYLTEPEWPEAGR